MKKILKTRKTFFVFLTTFILISCSSDDPGVPIIDPQTILENEQAETVQILSNTSNKTWKIDQAILTNENATLDISLNFNIVDDEFIFKSDGNLEWRQGFDINIAGTTNQETLLDFYRSPISSNFNFNENSGSDLNALDGRFTFTVVDESTINGVITYSGRNSVGGEIEITLSEKQAEDYAMPLTAGLNFAEVFTFQSNGIDGFAPGMIGSYSDNSLFLVTREDDLNTGSGSPERIIKFNLGDGTIEENLFFNQDFVSKQLHIINNQLVVIGGQYVNTYPLDFSSVPNSTTHGLQLTRFGMSVVDDDAYIIGGDIIGDGNGNYEAEKVYKWSLNNQSLEYVTDLPEDRYGARATIVNNNLYVFGGGTEFPSTENSAHDTIYIYDLVNGGFATEHMNSSEDFTFVDKYQNLIYVGAYHQIYNSEGNVIDYEFNIGVYNTEDSTYENIETNLSHEGWNNIFGMSIFNNQIFVIYGDGGETWQVMAADL